MPLLVLLLVTHFVTISSLVSICPSILHKKENRENGTNRLTSTAVKRSWICFEKSFMKRLKFKRGQVLVGCKFDKIRSTLSYCRDELSTCLKFQLCYERFPEDYPKFQEHVYLKISQLLTYMPLFTLPWTVSRQLPPVKIALG